MRAETARKRRIFNSNGAVSQGAILGLEAFCQMIKDMKASLPIYNFVEASTLYDILAKHLENRQLQAAMNETVK